MANATNNTTKWTINADLGKIGGSGVTRKLTIPTKDTYTDKDIEIAISAEASDPATLGASATGSATIDSATVGAKNGSKYSITGSASITGIASASTTESGYATKGTTTGTGSTTGTANLDASLDAITLSASGSGSATIDTVTVTKNDVSGKYDVTGSKAITGTASASVATEGYGKNETGSGSVTGTASVSASIDASALDNKAADGKAYVENTSVVIPSGGALYISEGYIPNTKITLDQMLDGKDDTAGIADADIRTGKVAYDVDGVKHTGSMGNATVKGGEITHTLGAPTYNSSTGVFDQDCEITTAAPTVSSSGYISSTDGTKTASTKKTENHALTKIVGETNITGTTTKQPTITKQDFTISGVTNAASGAATTTAPSTGVYVKVKSAANTGTLTATPSITTNGYGTSAANGLAANTATVGASESADTYVPIKTGSASVTGKSIGGSATDPTLNSSNKYDITFSASGTVEGSAEAGWVDSVSGATVTAGVTKTLNAAALTHENTATETQATVDVSGSRSSNLASPGTDTTYYVTVSGSQSAAGSVKHSASVTEGYVPSAGLSEEATIPTSAKVTGSGTKVYLKSTAVTGSISGTTSGTGYSNPVLSDTAPASGPYIDLVGNGSAASGAVYNGTATAAHKYMSVFDGTYTIS